MFNSIRIFLSVKIITAISCLLVQKRDNCKVKVIFISDSKLSIFSLGPHPKECALVSAILNYSY